MGEKLVGGGGLSVLFVFGFFGWRVWLRERKKNIRLCSPVVGGWCGFGFGFLV